MLFPRPSELRSVHSLDGFWDLTFDPEHQGLARGYSEKTPDQAEPVAVPASINEQFTERDRYLNMDWVWYHRTFYAEPTWKHRRVFLRFAAVNYRAEVYLNGHRLGEHEGGYTPFEFEVNQFLRHDGPNLLAVRVDNLLSELSIPQGFLPPSFGGVAKWRPGNLPDVHYDFFPFMGIHRSVHLYTTGTARLTDLRLSTLSLQGDQARLAVELRTDGLAEEVRLTCGALSLQATLHPGDQGHATAELDVAGVEAWSPERPRLYRISFEVLGQSEPSDRYEQPFGFRTVETTPRGLLLNARPIFLRGFGRHEEQAAQGRGLSPAQRSQDFQRLRWINANSFRTSHYPYAEEDLELADRLGILVISETPANTLGFHGLVDEPQKLEAFAAHHEREIAELIRRDFNHPCVIAWSLGNECETNYEPAVPHFERMVAHARHLDGTRPITFVTNTQGQTELAAHCFDFIAMNIYPTWYHHQGRLDELAELTRGLMQSMRDKYPDKPVMLAEFGADAVCGVHTLHSLMWSEEYQRDMVMGIIDVAESLPWCFGTHVWNLADFKVGQNVGRVVLNHKGVFTRDREPKLVAHALKERWSKPRRLDPATG